MRAQMFFPSFFFYLLCFLPPFHSFSSEVLTLQKTIVSPHNVFEFGCFQPNNEVSHWYLGIWYKKDPKRTCLWVANRDKPLPSPIGTLKFVNNDLVLLDQDNASVWKVNIRGGDDNSLMLAQLLDNGNLVVKDSNDPKEEYLWQSFDSPTDTLLPQMKLGSYPETKRAKTLMSWLTPNDPSSGNFLFGIRIGSHGIESFKQDLIWEEFPIIDTWNGYQFGDMPPVLQLDDSQDNFVMNPQNNHSRLTLGPNGDYELYKWISEAMEWKLSWSSSEDACYTNEPCGTYSYCSKDTLPLCHCIEGFDPKLEDLWAGCVRRTALNCSGDRFVKLQNMNLPSSDQFFVGEEIVAELCEKSCLMDCGCTAFAHVEAAKGQRSCLTWTGEIKDMRNYTLGGQDLYVRLAPAIHEDHTKNDGKSKGLDSWIIGLIVGLAIAGLIIVSFLVFYGWEKHKRRIQGLGGSAQSEIIMNEIAKPESFQLMEFEAIAQATDHFSEGNKLGKGGFGSVYKGTLPDGKEVAVKRLIARSSHGQGTTEFNNEVNLILRVLHVNLVRLLGCCSEGDEKILIYEYLENFSLNGYLFDKTQSSLLNWAQRYNIMKGIAEGLSYLHNFTTPPILHRDLKPSNILLGKDMIPKISDFGLAQIMEIGTTEAETERVVGTYGYTSEEYARHHIMSEKSDIFSYGVMLLEIISGLRNIDYCNTHHGDSLLDYVWRMWDEGHGLDVVDSDFHDSTFVAEQVLRSIKVGLLCVQQHVCDRPNTKSVVYMLESTESEIPRPTRPDYYYARFLIGETASSSLVAEQSNTINYITLPQVDGR